MNEASRCVVFKNQIKRITGDRLNIADLAPDAAMAVTLFGIFRVAEFPYNEALNISRSLNIALENKSGEYVPNDRFVGDATQETSKIKYYQNFRFFKSSAIYRIITSKSKKTND